MKKQIKIFRPMVVICLIAGIILSVLAPYGTHTLNPVIRFVYWVGLCFAGGFGAGITDVILHWRGWTIKPWQHAVGHSITSTLAVASILLMMAYSTFGPPSLKSFLSTLFYIWVVAATISLIGMLMRKQKLATTDVENNARPALYERLTPKLRSADIYALCAEDHYVRVITSRGEELVLMRLSDAIKETLPLKGLTPHRSWWVAEAGVNTVKKAGLALHSGQSVPISRTGMKHVREAGWV